MSVERHFNTIYFNGVNLSDYGVHVSGFHTLNAPERDYEIIEVPGKSGDLVIDKNRYKNISLSYDAWIAENLKGNAAALRNVLLGAKGYKRLEDTYHPDEFRMAMYVGPFTINEVVQWNAVTFSLDFNCKPQRFLKNGEIPIEKSRDYNTDLTILKLYNSTFNIAKPIIRVYGYGKINIYCETSNHTIDVASHPYGITYIDIDCDLGDCYFDITNCNSYVSFSNNVFPTLDPGEITIDFERTFSRIAVIPRWYIV